MDNKLEVTLTKQQRQIARAAAKDDSRPILQQVKIGGGRIIATDGHILAECSIITQGGAMVLVDAKTILTAKDGKDIPASLSYNGNGEVQLTDAAGNKQLKQNYGTYPNTDALYPDTGTAAKEVFHIAISPKILKQLAGIVGDETLIKFRFYGTTSPVKFEAGKTKGVLMPMFAQWD